MQPKSKLYRMAVRLQKKCEKQGYQYTELQLNMFEALGRAEWDESKVSWLVLEQFEWLYARFYPN